MLLITEIELPWSSGETPFALHKLYYILKIRPAQLSCLGSSVGSLPSMQNVVGESHLRQLLLSLRVVFGCGCNGLPRFID